MPEAYTPPAHGSPCYLEIPVLEPARAKTFYGAVFNWSFRSHPDYNANEGEMIGFSFPETNYRALNGGFKKVNEVAGANAPKLYFYVGDLTEVMEAIVANGGRKLSDIKPEGKFGEFMDAEDTEGNYLGIFKILPKEA